MSHLDVLPGVHHLIWWVSKQTDVAPPGVEVRRIRLNILPTLSQPVRVEDKLVRGEEDAAQSNVQLTKILGQNLQKEHLMHFAREEL